MASEKIRGDLESAYKELEGYISGESWTSAFAAVAYLKGNINALNNCGHLQFSENSGLALIFRDLLDNVRKEKKGKSLDKNMAKLKSRLEAIFRVKL